MYGVNLYITECIKYHESVHYKVYNCTLYCTNIIAILKLIPLRIITFLILTFIK